MPQPRRAAVAADPPEQAPPKRRTGGAAAAATVSTVLPASSGGLAAAAASAAAAAALTKVPVGVPGDAQVAAAAAALLDAIDVLFRQRRATFDAYVRATAQQQMPGAAPDRIEALAQAEMNREVEFQRKARARLEKDLPLALRIEDPQARADAVTAILEREKRFLRQREDAAAQRVVAMLEMDLIRDTSPEGAYWMLSPLIREHCAKCLAMANKFWPWEVLDLPGMHLPLHPNCGCRLLGLDEAVSQGLMAADQVPDTQDAIRRAKLLMSDARRLEETLAPEELERVIGELEERRLQEGSMRDYLRFHKGYAKGGEFAPRGGGNPGASLVADAKHLAQQLFHGYEATPMQSRTAKRGRRVKIKGAEHFIPQADAFAERIGGVHYQSPPGSTHLYRDGILMPDDHPDLGGAGVGKPGVPAAEQGEHMTSSLRYTGGPVDGIPDYTGTHLKLTKRAGGSTGAMFATDDSGDRWLIKSYQGNRDRVATELLANAIYRDLGTPVAQAGTIRDGDRVALAYQTLPGEPHRIDAPSAELGKHFMADSLLANWDFIGLADDNVIWDGDQPVRVDQGGTLQYRAQGQPKPFGPVPTEAWTMLGPKGQGFGKVAVSEGQMRTQAADIAQRLTPERIDALVDQAPFADDTMREEVRKALNDRVGWMARFATGEESLPQPLEGKGARDGMSRWQAGLEPTPEEYSELEQFVGDDKYRHDLQEQLRHGTAKDATPQQRSSVARLDSLLRASTTDDDVTLYRPFDAMGTYGHEPGELVGRTLRDDGFFTATTQLSAARAAPGMLQLTVPSGIRAVYTPQVEGLSEDAGGIDPELDVLLSRGTRIRVVSVERRAGRDVINGVVLPPW